MTRLGRRPSILASMAQIPVSSSVPSMFLIFLGCAQRPAPSLPFLLEVSPTGQRPGTTVEADGVTARIGNDELGANFAIDGSVDIAGELRVRTLTLGRTGASLPFAHAGPRTGDCEAEPCILFAGSQLTERWRARGAAGLEQGWTVHIRPPGAGALELAISMPGARVSADGSRAEMTGGARGWTVSKLRAWDANGVVLGCGFEATAEGLRVAVDDFAAAYPVTIDPLYSRPDYELGSDLLHLEGGGDVNGDGYGDIVATDDGAGGNGYVFYGTADGIETGAGSHLTGVYNGQSSEVAIGFAGDVNGDGYDDVIAVAEYAGEVYVWAGSPDGIVDEPTWTLPETATSTDPDQLASAAGAGDVNGDGYADIIVGSARSGSPGSASVFLGSAEGPREESAVLLTASEPVSDDLFGDHVGAAGDVNGDGFGDVIVGAETPYTAVLYGSAAGVVPSTMTLLATARRGVAGEVHGVRDINGDGYDDVLVGISGWVDDDGSTNLTGEVSIFLGGAAGVNSEPDWVRDGPTSTSYYGAAAGGLGDVNADGFDDVVVGTGDGEPAEVFLGGILGLSSDPVASLQADYGARSAFGAGDIDRDGRNDAVLGGGHIYLASTFLDPEADSDSDADADADSDADSDTADSVSDSGGDSGAAPVSGCSSNKGGCSTVPTGSGEGLFLAASAAVALGRRRATAREGAEFTSSVPMSRSLSSDADVVGVRAQLIADLAALGLVKQGSS